MSYPHTARARRAALVTALVLSATAGACTSGSDGASSSSSEPGVASTAAPPTNGVAPSSSTGGGSSTSSTIRTTTSTPTGTSGSAGTATSAPTTSTATAADVPGGPPFLDAGAVAERDFPGTNALAVLAAVRVGHQVGFDRVVFEFRAGDALPGYRVRFQDLPVHADPSDEVVALTGDGALVVRMQAASRFDFSAVPPAQYGGPPVVSAATGSVTQVAVAGDFEALLSWAIGVRDHPAFRVFELQGPPRIVVDVASAG